MSNPIYKGHLFAAYTTFGFYPLSLHFDGLKETPEVSKMILEFLVHLGATTSRVKPGEIVRFSGILEIRPKNNFAFEGAVATMDPDKIFFNPFHPISVSSNY